MDSKQWELVTEIFEATLGLQPQERAPFLAKACQGDHQVRIEVDSLLWAHGCSADFIETPLAESALAVLSRDSTHLRAEPRLALGQSILHYRIDDKIGEGGMGVVYLAKDTHLDRSVAIKVLLPGKGASQEQRLRFVREAKAASALNHPNIVTIHDTATVDGIDFIVMEYVAGQRLDELLAAGPIALQDVIGYASQIAGALAAAHATGIIHRDLKPPNVMVGDNGLVKVLDFGVAKRINGIPTTEAPGASVADGASTPLTLDGTLVGTDAYMSPEQVEGGLVDARSDIFSFGSLLYEMVSGAKAFPGNSRTEVLDAIVGGTIRPLSEIVPDIPRSLQEIVGRCLERSAGSRWQSIGEAKRAVDQLNGELRLKKDGSEVSRESRRNDRSKTRRLAWLLAMGSTLLCAGAWYRIARNVRSETMAPSLVLPFTTYAGSEGDGSFSPDGNQVAFVWDGEKMDNNDIYVKQVGQASLRRLTSDRRSDFSPAWSPDGQSVAFIRELEEGKSAVMLIPVNQGGERQIAEINTRRVLLKFRWLSWHPDGNWLAVASDQDSADLPAAIHLLSPRTGEMRRLTSPPKVSIAHGGSSGDTNPAFSPDGRSMVFVRFSTVGVSDVLLLRIARGLVPESEPKQLTFGNKWTGTPAWFPDGKSIIFASGKNAGANVLGARLWKTSVVTSEMAQPVSVSGLGNVVDPAISPAARRLIYRSFSINLNIWRHQIPTAGDSPMPAAKLIPSSMIQGGARFSPDGKKVAFTSHASGTGEIWVCGADGSNLAQLTHLDGPRIFSFSWSPNGQDIVLSSASDGKHNLYLVKMDGGRIKPLADTHFNAHGPRYSRDARWVYFDSDRTGDSQIWKIPAEGGDAVRVTKSGGRNPLESVDGRTLYYLKGKDLFLGDLWKIPTAGGAETRVLERVSKNHFDLSEQGIYYATPDERGTQLLFYNFASGKTRRIAPVQQSIDWGLSVSPDARWMLVTQMDGQPGSDLVLVENFR